MSEETRDFGSAERLPETASAHRARQRYTGACRPINSDLGWSKAVHTRDKPVVLRGNFPRGHALFVSAKKKEKARVFPVETTGTPKRERPRYITRRKTHGTRKTRHKTPGTAEEVSQ